MFEESGQYTYFSTYSDIYKTIRESCKRFFFTNLQFSEWKKLYTNHNLTKSFDNILSKIRMNKGSLTLKIQMEHICSSKINQGRAENGISNRKLQLKMESIIQQIWIVPFGFVWVVIWWQIPSFVSFNLDFLALTLILAQWQRKVRKSGRSLLIQIVYFCYCSLFYIIKIWRGQTLGHILQKGSETSNLMWLPNSRIKWLTEWMNPRSFFVM